MASGYVQVTKQQFDEIVKRKGLVLREIGMIGEPPVALYGDEPQTLNSDGFPNFPAKIVLESRSYFPDRPDKYFVKSELLMEENP